MSPGHCTSENLWSQYFCENDWLTAVTLLLRGSSHAYAGHDFSLKEK